jgi:hypothetical protein
LAFHSTAFVAEDAAEATELTAAKEHPAKNTIKPAHTNNRFIHTSSTLYKTTPASAIVSR